MRLYNLLFIALFLMPASRGHSEDFTIQRYDIKVVINGKEGYFDVKEKIQLTFSTPRRGIIRTVPNRYKFDGKTLKVQISDVKVAGFKFKTYQEGNNLAIRIGEQDIFVNGEQEYVISYRVKSAFVFQEEHTEFYWNLVGIDWDTSIDQVSFEVKFDKNLSLSDADYYVVAGRAGSQEQKVQYKYYGNKITGYTTQPLNPREGVTIAVKMGVDDVKRPSAFEQLWQQYGWIAIPLMIVLFFTGFFYDLWRRYGKDKPIVKMVQYSPPKEISPSEAGLLIDERADNRDVIALIPYWACNGLIQMRHIPKVGMFGKDDYELIKKAQLPSDAPIYEQTIFNALFAGRDRVLISSLRQKFHQHITNSKIQLRYALDSKGVYTPHSIRYQRKVGMISGFLVVFGFITIFLLGLLPVGISLILSGGIGFVFYNFMRSKNDKGLKLYEHTVGFRMFMEKAEKDKLEFLLKEDPLYFEKTLPYAVIFGMAKKWGQKFDGLLMEPPSWYIGPNYGRGAMFSPANFGSDFENGMNEIQSAFVSAPQSSGGGFSGGGGSVGGGFGGGGGRSW